MPATLKRTARTETVRRGAMGRPDVPARAAEDRSAYRRAPSGPGGAPHDKKADVGPGSADVEFVSLILCYLLKFFSAYRYNRKLLLFIISSHHIITY